MSDTKTKLINGVEFEVSTPYAAGHSITEAEAKALNQVRSENIGNNVRAKVKELIEAGKLDEAKAHVAKVDSEYVFTLAGVSSARKLDPVEKEAVNLARELVKAELAKTGRKLTVAPEGTTQEDWDNKIAAEVERIAGLEAVVKIARKNVEAKKKTSEALLAAVAAASESAGE